MSSKQKTGGEKYDHASIEPYWQTKWEDEKIYQPHLDSAISTTTEEKKFYNLNMFPYPSAEGLHVGNMYAFTGGDIYGRFMRMRGRTVFQPIGLDGFGIHSENYALKVGSHPMAQADKSEKNFYRQLRTIGNGYDWSRTVETWKPDYYKWTQWVFTELFKAGLAYRSASDVNWCPSCKTVLADEQVIDGLCERCSFQVEKRQMEQWFFRITNYSERLLNDLEKIDWTEKVKIAQRNWIGKSEGARVTFTVILNDSEGWEAGLDVFTTRPDTLHGATFMVVSPEHPIVTEIVQTITDDEIKKNVTVYVEQASKQSDKERRDEAKEKTGVFSGVYAVNPVNNQRIPVWIADYVLMGYGTGAIMAVPAHDQRDFAFAKKYDLPIIEVVSGGNVSEGAYTGDGSLVNSGEWNGWKTLEAKKKAIEWLQKHKVGQKTTNYHLRDWLISRQRYWGAPIPMIYCQTCADQGKSWFTSPAFAAYKDRLNRQKSSRTTIPEATVGVVGWYPEENLPVVLPDIEDYRPVGTGKAPLANHPEFYETTCPGCGHPAKRETDVCDTFLDSGWYFLRYPATDLSSIPFPMREETAKTVIQTEKDASGTSRITEEELGKSSCRVVWLPVDQYTGGAEHSVLHLLYSRFIYKVFCDLGYINAEAGGDEPFPKFFAHGLIIKDGAKMSKSKGNVVVPDVYIKKYGADTLRTYLMFLGPFSEGGDFQDAGIEGINRYLKRVWKLITTKPIVSRVIDKNAKALMHRTIKGVSSDLSDMRYNTAIAKLMTWYNALVSQEVLTQEEVGTYLKLLAPFAPHMTEELYQQYGGVERFESIHTSKWPEFDESQMVEETVTIAVQVNGKLRETIRVESEKAGEQKVVEQLAKDSEKVRKFIDGKEIRKVIFVPGKILNIVV